MQMPQKTHPIRFPAYSVGGAWMQLYDFVKGEEIKREVAKIMSEEMDNQEQLWRKNGVWAPAWLHDPNAILTVLESD